MGGSRALAALSLTFLFASPLARAQCELQELTASDTAAGARYGYSVAVSGETLVVGAAGDVPSGAAYVSVRQPSGWVEQAKLAPSDGESADRFGWSVAISGSTATTPARSSFIPRPAHS